MVRSGCGWLVLPGHSSQERNQVSTIYILRAGGSVVRISTSVTSFIIWFACNNSVTMIRIVTELENPHIIHIILRSLRDLTGEHLPLLKNIQERGTEAIAEKYGLQKSQVCIFLHWLWISQIMGTFRFGATFITSRATTTYTCTWRVWTSAPLGQAVTRLTFSALS